MLAANLKECEDFNAFLPWYWCNELDSMVMMISLMNSQTLPVTNVNIESLLDQIRDVLQTSDMTD
jgi:hypothetical protein